jgi:hypothetical protein
MGSPPPFEGTDSSGTADGTSGSTTGGTATDGTGTGAGTAGSEDTGLIPVDPCGKYAQQYIECVDPAADFDELVLECSLSLAQAEVALGKACVAAINAGIECIYTVDCAAFIAYDGGHGVVPPRCQDEIDVQNATCQ